MRLTLEQIYQGQVEVMTSEQRQRHLADLDRLRETLRAEHAEEMSRLESEWSSRMSELEREHEDELNDSLLEDSLSKTVIYSLHFSGRACCLNYSKNVLELVKVQELSKI